MTKATTKTGATDDDTKKCRNRLAAWLCWRDGCCAELGWCASRTSHGCRGANTFHGDEHLDHLDN